MEQEPEIDGDDLIAAIDELLAADSSPALLPKESECQTASAETGGSTQAATSSSMATAGSVVNGMEKSEPMEPFKENEVEGRDKKQIKTSAIGETGVFWSSKIWDCLWPTKTRLPSYTSPPFIQKSNPTHLIISQSTGRRYAVCGCDKFLLH